MLATAQEPNANLLGFRREVVTKDVFKPQKVSDSSATRDFIHVSDRERNGSNVPASGLMQVDRTGASKASLASHTKLADRSRPWRRSKSCSTSVQRWQLEVTFEEARRHLGMQTQRQWSALAIARTTPVLLGLYSLVTLLATQLVQRGALPIRQAAWYRKTLPTFSNALAAVRKHWWRSIGLSISTCEHDIIKVPRRVFQRLHEAACYAA